MKDKLDAVWNDSVIACPMNVAAWNTIREGYSNFSKYGLWYKKGKKLNPKLTSRKRIAAMPDRRICKII